MNEEPHALADIDLDSGDPVGKVKAVFRQALGDGIEKWRQAGAALNTLCELLGEEEAYAEVRAEMPIPKSALDGFRKLGSGKIIPEILIDGSPGATALAALPLEEQRTLWDEGVAINGNHFSKAKRIVPISELTAAQVHRVFDGGRVRTPSEQALVFQKETTRRPKRAGRNPQREGQHDYIMQEREGIRTPAAANMIIEADGDIRTRLSSLVDDLVEMRGLNKETPSLDMTINLLGRLNLELAEAEAREAAAES